MVLVALTFGVVCLLETSDKLGTRCFRPLAGPQSETLDLFRIGGPDPMFRTARFVQTNPDPLAFHINRHSV